MEKSRRSGRSARVQPATRPCSGAHRGPEPGDSADRPKTLTQALSGSSYDLTLGLAYNPGGQIVTRTRSNDLYGWTNHPLGSKSYTDDGLNRDAAPRSLSSGLTRGSRAPAWTSR